MIWQVKFVRVPQSIPRALIRIKRIDRAADFNSEVRQFGFFVPFYLISLLLWQNTVSSATCNLRMLP